MSSSAELRELIELYSVLDVLTDTFHRVTGPHIRLNWLVDLPSRKRLEACWTEIIGN